MPKWPPEGHRDKSESAFAVVKTAPTIHTTNDNRVNEAHSLLNAGSPRDTPSKNNH
jgi:hypothetical protein